MSNLETKLNAMCAVLMANTAEERRLAVEDLKTVMETKVEKPKDTESVIRDLMLYLGTPDHLNGYDMAVYAIKLCIEDRKYLNHISYVLYPTVALEFSTTTSRVERGIRFLITTTFERGNKVALEKVFGTLVDEETGKVTNSEYLGRMTNVTKQRLRSM